MVIRSRLFIPGIIIVFALALAGLLAGRAATSAPAAGIIITDTYCLTETRPDTLVVLADTIEITAEAGVTGSAALAGSQVQMDGQIDGDLTVLANELVIGGSVRGSLSFVGDNLRLSGHIAGDLTLIGASLTSQGGQVLGQVRVCGGTLYDEALAARARPCSASVSPLAATLHTLLFQGLPAPALALVWPLALWMTALSALAVTVFPRRFGCLAAALTGGLRPYLAGIMALVLCAGLFSALIALLAAVPPLGLALLPFGLLLLLILLLLAALGWAALALLIGGWLSRRLHWHDMPPLLAAALGSLLLSAAVCAAALLPFGLPLSLLLLTLAGLSAGIATRLGARSLRPPVFVQG